MCSLLAGTPEALTPWTQLPDAKQLMSLFSTLLPASPVWLPTVTMVHLEIITHPGHKGTAGGWVLKGQVHFLS